MRLRISLMPLKRDPNWSKTLFFSWHGLMPGRGMGHNSGLPSLHAVNFFLGKYMKRICFEALLGVSAHRIDKIGVIDQRFGQKDSKPSKLGASIDSFCLILYNSVAEPLPSQLHATDLITQFLFYCSCFNVFLLLVSALVSLMLFWGWFGLDLRNDGGQGQRVAIQKMQVHAMMLRVFQKWKVRLMGSWCSICNRTLPFCLQCPALVDWQMLGPNWQLFLPTDLVYISQEKSSFPTSQHRGLIKNDKEVLTSRDIVRVVPVLHQLVFDPQHSWESFVP